MQHCVEEHADRKVLEVGPRHCMLLPQSQLKHGKDIASCITLMIWKSEKAPSIAYP